MLSYLLQLKIIWISSSIYFFLQFLQIFISSWRLYHLGDVYCEVMGWQPYVSYGVPIGEVMQT